MCQTLQLPVITSAPLLSPSLRNLLTLLSKLRENLSRDAKIRPHDRRQSPNLTSGASKAKCQLESAEKVEAQRSPLMGTTPRSKVVYLMSEIPFVRTVRGQTSKRTG